MLEPLDVARLARQRSCLAGSIPLQSCPRLLDMLASCEGELSFEIHFDKALEGRACAEGSLSVGLPLLCYRCASPFEYPMVQSFKWSFVRSEEEADSLDENVEPVLAPMGQWVCRDALEDQILLAWPLMPHCTRQACADMLRSSEDEDQTSRPFLDLSRLLNL